MTYFRLFASSAALSLSVLPGQALDWKMPRMPDSLRTVEERAAYLTEHYWDSVDWGDATQAGDSEGLEGVFADYCVLLPLLPDDQRSPAVKHTLDEARSGNAGGYETLMALAGTYLWQTDSPVYDEEAYRPFVEYGLRVAPDDAVLQGRMEELAKNAPDTPAADIRLVRYAVDGMEGSDGESVSLYSTLCEGGPTIVVFYSPDCRDCHDFMASLAGNAPIGLKIGEGKLGVTAVSVSDDVAAWRADAVLWPKEWSVTMLADPDDEAYSVRRTPTVYLLDSDGQVILRNASAPALVKALL